jgi:hypothetical protein
MIEIINTYHIDYYIRNKFIDCSQVLKNNQLSPQQSDYDYEEAKTNLAELAELESMIDTLDINSFNTISNRRNSMESNPIVEKDNDEQYQEYMNYKEQTEKPRYQKSHRQEYKTHHNNHNHYHQRKSEPMFKENDSFSRIYLKSIPKKKYKKQN